MILENVKEVFLSQNQVFLSTVEGDMPHVRPMDKFVEIDGKVAFCTKKGKAMFNQLSANGNVEAVTMFEGKTIRLSGHVTLDDSAEMKAKYLEIQPTTANHYGGGEETMAVFVFDKATLTTGFRGQKEETVLY